MTAATLGTVVPVQNPNNNTNTSLAVTLATTTPGELNIITISGLATGTGINPTMTTPTGWAKLFEQMSNSGTPSSFVAIYSRVYQSGDGSSVTISWANAGQMVAICKPFSGQDGTTPIPYSLSTPKSGSNTAYAIAGTTGTDQGLLVYGAANRTGTAWSGLSDNAVTTSSLASSATMVERITATELAGSSAYSKTMTGSNTSIGVEWAFIVKGTSTVDANITPAVVDGTTTVPAPTVTAGNNALITPGVVSGTRSIPTPTIISGSAAVQWVKNTSPMYIAHRGGYAATLGEGTLEAYTAAAAWNSKAALEVPVWKCSTGEYVVCHNRDTVAVFGVSNDIPTTSWTTLSTLTTTIGGNAIRRLTDIMSAFPNRIFVVDNKQDTNAATLISLLDANIPGKWIGKQYYTSSATWLTSCQNDGAPVWGYFYPPDLTNLATCLGNLSAAKSPIIFGLGDYNVAPVPIQSDANTFFTFTAANNLYTWAHILRTSGQKVTADSQATTAGATFSGYMAQGFTAVAPADASTPIGSTVPGLVSIPTPTVTTGSGVSITGVVVQGSSTISAPIENTGSVVTPAVVNGTRTISAPVVTTGSSLLPSVVSGSTNVFAPTVLTGLAITPSVISGLSSVPVPTITTGLGIMLSVVNGVSSFPSCTVITGLAITPSVVGGTRSIPTPNLSTGSIKSASVISGLTSIFAPVVFVSGAAHVTPGVISCVAIIPLPFGNDVNIKYIKIAGVAAHRQRYVDVDGVATPID